MKIKAEVLFSIFHPQLEEIFLHEKFKLSISELKLKINFGQ